MLNPEIFFRRPSPNRIERRTTDAEVRGSNPRGRANYSPVMKWKP